MTKSKKKQMALLTFCLTLLGVFLITALMYYESSRIFLKTFLVITVSACCFFKSAVRTLYGGELEVFGFPLSAVSVWFFIVNLMTCLMLAASDTQAVFALLICASEWLIWHNLELRAKKAGSRRL